MDARIQELTSACDKNPGASPEALDQLIQSLKVRLPADYLHLLAEINGLEGFVGENYLQLWSVERVKLYGVYEFMPFLIFIGSNGGGEGFAYDTRSVPMPIVNVPFIGMDGEVIRIFGYSILEFLERLQKAPLF